MVIVIQFGTYYVSAMYKTLKIKIHDLVSRFIGVGNLVSRSTERT